MTLKLLSKLASIGLVLLAANALALPEDRQLTINGKSNEKTIDTSTGIIVMTGSVFFTQGHLEIYSDKTIVETDKKTNQLSAMIATGSPARFIDLPSADGEIIEISGKKIEFYPLKNLIIATGDAQILHNGNVARGERIEYNAITGVMSVQAKRSLSGNPEDEQAELIIQPGAVD